LGSLIFLTPSFKSHVSSNTRRTIVLTPKSEATSLITLHVIMASPNCATCNKPSPSLRLHKKCSGCQSSSYCSKACQKEDWRTHQLVCAQFKSFLTSNPRPSSAHKLALLLPVNKKQPQFVWLHCIMRFEGYEYPQDREFLGADNPFLKRIPVSANMASSKFNYAEICP